MGRGGVVDTTSLLNFGEEHLTSMWRWVLISSRPPGYQTTCLVLPRKGIERAAAAAVGSSLSLKA